MKWITNYTAIISALLLFTGYINYSTYYNQFDIDISKFLSTGELLLSFLPLTIPILILIAIAATQLLSFVAIIGKETPPTDPDPVDHNLIDMFLSSFPRIKARFKKIKYKQIRIDFQFVILTTIDIIIGLIGVSFSIFLVVFIVGFFFSAVFKNSIFHVSMPMIAWIILSIFWLTLFLDVLVKKQKLGWVKFSDYMTLLVTFCLFIGLVIINKKQEAYLVLKGIPDYSVSILYNGKEIKTDSNLIYIGMTNNYLFLRDLNEKSNRVFEFDDIQNFQISKTSK